jgi:hypothetical protein
MINKIDNVSFKAIYTPKNKPFSYKQKAVLNNIKNELGENKKRDNFFAKPIDKDKVQLSLIHGVRKAENRTDTRITYTRKAYIGTYDKKNPFKVNDYFNVMHQEAKDVIGALAVGVLAIGMILGGLFISANKKEVSKPQVEKVMNMTKDSAQVVKDSLKIFK